MTAKKQSQSYQFGYKNRFCHDEWAVMVQGLGCQNPKGFPFRVLQPSAI
jgi:hypothetical protein